MITQVEQPSGGSVMRRLFALLFLGVLTVPAAAQPWYARGDFGTPSPPPGNPTGELSPWNDLSFPMVQDPINPIHYTRTVGSPEQYFPGIDLEYKLAEEDFDPAHPGSNG